MPIRARRRRLERPLSFLLPAVLAAPAFTQSLPEFRYDVRFAPRDDRTDLVVEARFRTGAEDELLVGLPHDDAFGTPDLARFVATFEGAEGTTVRAHDERVDHRWVTPDDRGDVHLRYTISLCNADFGSSTYAPNSSDSHLHLAFAQWLLRIGDGAVDARYRVSVDDLPEGWSGYCSLGRDLSSLEVDSSRDGLSRAVLGAMRGAARPFDADGLSVAVFVAEASGYSSDTAEAVEQIVRAERRAFGDTSKGFFDVAILPREQNVAGVALNNAFVCFVMPEASRERLLLLFAHEMMHTWVNGDIRFGEPGARSRNFVRNMWFVEGVNEHLARVVLRDTGLFGDEELAAAVNRDLVNLADSPHAAKPFERIMAEANEGRWNNGYQKLSYYRGALMALDWEHRLRESGSDASLMQIVRGLRVDALREGMLDDDTFFEHFERHGLDAAADYERVVLRGEPVRVDGGALGDGFEAVERQVPSFDPGFDLGASRRSSTVTGVVNGGPAHRAGLRDGMPLVRTANATRFGNAWEADAPLRVVVVLEGEEREIAFDPHGPAHTVTQFVPR